MTCLVGFYALTVLLSLRRLRSSDAGDDEALPYARMAAAGIAGFMAAAAFVSLDALEAPYHTVLLGAAALKLSRAREDEQEEATAPLEELYAVPIDEQRLEPSQS